jgi:hypothetical protein
VSPKKHQTGKAALSAPSAPILDSAQVIKQILRETDESLAEAKGKRDKSDEKRKAAGKPVKPRKKSLSYSIHFAKRAGAAMAAGLEPYFHDMKSGETPSRGLTGAKRVDVNYSTREMGLGLAISLKSVHSGEEMHGDADFIHNMKRNDEEWRVEATQHHIRQPYSVLVAVLFLPFQACTDLSPTSSFASWVEYLWQLKGRDEPDDAPDKYELVFVALYARDGSRLGFYQVGGEVKCPRYGEPKSLTSFERFLALVRKKFIQRNSLEFTFEGEEPPA